MRCFPTPRKTCLLSLCKTGVQSTLITPDRTDKSGTSPCQTPLVASEKGRLLAKTGHKFAPCMKISQNRMEI